MALLPRAGWVVLCFRHDFVTLGSGPSLAPRLAGFTVPARPTRDKSQWENVISCGGGQVFLVRLGGASSAVRAVHIATSCSVKVGSSISVSFWLRMPGHGVLALGHETVCFVSLGLGALVLSLRIFFVKNLLSSWWTGVGVALALILARLLLRDCCPLVPRTLLPVLWVAVRDLG